MIFNVIYKIWSFMSSNVNVDAIVFVNVDLIMFVTVVSIENDNNHGKSSNLLWEPMKLELQL